MKVSIVDLQVGARIADGSLPLRVVFPPVVVGEPDDGIAIFHSVGQTEPAHAPRYKCVEEVIVTQAPDFPHLVTSETVEVGNDRVELSRTYLPDQGAYQRAIEDHIESTATSRGYSSTVSLASYVTSTIPQWKAEADAFTAWRDAVWLKVLTELAKVQQGERFPPVLEEFMQELPAMEWPAG